VRILMTAALVAAAGAAACSGTPTNPETLSVPIRLTPSQQADGSTGLSVSQHAGTPHNLRTHLSGAEEVPARDTEAQGQAIFQVEPSGMAVSYKLIVANIENVLQAHIHVAAAGVNGGIVVWLYPSGPPPMLIPGRSDGILAEGTITADSLVNALAGQPLSALLDAMRAGNTYVNVHTSQFPPGEIRGQID
jgi:CHRD domain